MLQHEISTSLCVLWWFSRICTHVGLFGNVNVTQSNWSSSITHPSPQRSRWQVYQKVEACLLKFLDGTYRSNPTIFHSVPLESYIYIHKYLHVRPAGWLSRVFPHKHNREAHATPGRGNPSKTSKVTQMPKFSSPLNIFANEINIYLTFSHMEVGEAMFHLISTIYDKSQMWINVLEVKTSTMKNI